MTTHPTIADFIVMRCLFASMEVSEDKFTNMTAVIYAGESEINEIPEYRGCISIKTITGGMLRKKFEDENAVHEQVPGFKGTYDLDHVTAVWFYDVPAKFKQDIHNLVYASELTQKLEQMLSPEFKACSVAAFPELEGMFEAMALSESAADFHIRDPKVAEMIAEKIGMHQVIDKRDLH